MMKISEIMTRQVVALRGEETAATAARLLSSCNIGAAPVVDGRNRVVGMVTDRDLMIRCLSAGKRPDQTAVSQIMTAGAVTARPEEDTAVVSAQMGLRQIRRMPVVENGRLMGMVSLSDIAKHDPDSAVTALGYISDNISRR